LKPAAANRIQMKKRQTDLMAWARAVLTHPTQMFYDANCDANCDATRRFELNVNTYGKRTFFAHQ
jgi:hypothetical protein